jgi:hypothetical protein
MKWDGTKISRRNKMLLGDLIINYDNKRIPLSAKQRENIEKNYPYYGAQGIIDYVDDYLFEGKYLLIAEFKVSQTTDCNHCRRKVLG